MVPPYGLHSLLSFSRFFSYYITRMPTDQIPLYLNTFNLAKKPLDPVEYLLSIVPTLPKEPAHLYVFGFQEFCTVMDGCFEETARLLLIKVNEVAIEVLKTGYGYGPDALSFTTIAFQHVGAIGLFAITPYPSKFRDCKTATASCGNGGTSLKGGVGIRVKYVYEESKLTELTFTNAHLGAFEGEVYYQRRIRNIWAIQRALDFGDGYSFLKPGSHAFFMGDLNFRTRKDPKDEVRKQEVSQPFNYTTSRLPEAEVELLVLKYDELTQGKANGDLFSGFTEGCITFKPTYKYHPGMAIYNQRRCPLWCDRIFYQSTYRKEQPKILAYDSIDEYLRSDHRPVYLLITIPREAPESIIGHNGNLVILPSNIPNRHLSHNARKDMRIAEEEDIVSGPTMMYMKCTAMDKLKQLYIRRVADKSLGTGLWLGTTTRGRLTLLFTIYIVWFLFYLFG